MSNIRKTSKTASRSTTHKSTPDLLVKDISSLIEEARTHVAREYNSTQALLCWLIGKRIDEEFLNLERAEYGETIVASLSTQLSLTYGKGYSRPNLFRMIKFAKQFPNREIVSTLSRQLSWSHFVLISAIDDQLKRDFYAEIVVFSIGVSGHSKTSLMVCCMKEQQSVKSQKTLLNHS